jgi:hypothetical protein
MSIGGRDPATTHKPAMTATINGRTFQLTENTDKLANLRSHLIDKGFDGSIWEGFSARTGRQRKDLRSIIYRKSCGEFVIAISV